MNFAIYLIQQVLASLWYYRGFVLSVYIIGGVVALYCLFV